LQVCFFSILSASYPKIGGFLFRVLEKKPWLVSAEEQFEQYLFKESKEFEVNGLTHQTGLIFSARSGKQPPILHTLGIADFYHWLSFITERPWF
jgi:hypothetical protein